MLKNFTLNKVFWYCIVSTTLVISVLGVTIPGIYNGVIPPEFVPAAFPQDVVTIILCIFLLSWMYRIKENDIKLQIIVLGIIASFFYLYGIFTIERTYNFLYLGYVAIFAMSFWSVLLYLINFNKDAIRSVMLSPLVAKLTAGFALVIAVLFTVLWITALLPLMRDHNRIEYLYSIYILDLCFIMPAFFATSILTIIKNVWGMLLLPAVYVVGFFVIFPLGLGEIAKPFYGQSINYQSMAVSFVFSFTMLLAGFTHLKKLKIHEK